LIQSVPMYSPTKITNPVKSITAREIFKLIPDIKKKYLWGGEFWSKGFFINTVGQHGKTIARELSFSLMQKSLF
jgi:putative transposase